VADSDKKAPFRAPRPVARPALDPIEPPTTLMPKALRPFVAQPSEPMTVVESSTPPEKLAQPQQTQATDMLAGAKETRQLDLSGAALAMGDRIGNYVVERVIGSGGMGLVVAARHEGLNELVAIKVLRPKAASDEVHAERFAREARAIAKIKSEHVVRVLDAAAPEGGAPFIVMEYLVGRDLARILREEGKMPVLQAAGMMLQICEAVASAHAVGVIHRDLKPSNFFVTTRTDGQPLVKVLDFGISKAIGQDGLVDPNLTETQAVFGSPTYMSPEQIRSAKHVDQRSDIWSLGVGFYEILTGKLPFAADNVAGLLASIVADPPFYPRGFVPELPEALEILLLQCLAKDARERVQSVAELAFRIAPFAPPTAGTQDLVDRIDRLAIATNAHVMTGPRLPAPLPGPVRPISYPELLPAVAPSARGSGATLGNSANTSFGSTGMDLSAEAAGLPRRGGVVAAAAVGIVVALLVLVGVVGAYELGTHRKEPGAAGPAPSESAVAMAPSGSTPPSVPLVAASAPNSEIPSASVSVAKPGTKPVHPRPHPTPHPVPTKSVDPTNDRY